MLNCEEFSSERCMWNGTFDCRKVLFFIPQKKTFSSCCSKSRHQFMGVERDIWEEGRRLRRQLTNAMCFNTFFLRLALGKIQHRTFAYFTLSLPNESCHDYGSTRSCRILKMAIDYCSYPSKVISTTQTILTYGDLASHSFWLLKRLYFATCFTSWLIRWSMNSKYDHRSKSV